jgi:LysM repeat protein
MPVLKNQTLSTMKKFLILTFVMLLGTGLFAQQLLVQNSPKGSAIVHTVAPKENFYSLGRMYNIPPKEIAAFNGLEMERGLTIGQLVQIPLTAQNFSQEKATSFPVYYTVGDKEGLYRVSVNNNKVLMANLRKWNNLSSDAVSAGQRLIVGYLVSSDPTLASAMKAGAPERTDVARLSEEKPLSKREEEKPVVRTETTPERKAEPVAERKAELIVENKPEPVAERKPEQAKAVTTTAVNDNNGGYFKGMFDAQMKSQPLQKDEMAAAGIFKTASGWQDAKYYALIDNVEPGTIIRIVNPNNNKAVYAKVLDKMTGIRQNQGYDVRISNAAATALDITDTEKFFVRVHY